MAFDSDWNAWVLYTEESMLIEHLEAHYPACMRQLWDHISRGGLFADHLPVNDMMALEGVYNFIIREWNQVLSSLLPDGSKRTSGENRWIQLLEQWLWDTKDELDHLLLAGWDGPSLLRGLLARAGLRGCPPYGLIVQNMVSRLSSELCIGEGPTAPLTHAAWAVTTETRLYALCVQHGGTTATTDSSTRGISTASGSASSSSNPVPIATNFTGLEGPLISEGIQMLGPGPDAHSDINDVGFENEDPPTSEDTQTLGVRPDTHSDIKDVDIENEDAVSLMANKGVNKRWRSAGPADPGGAGDGQLTLQDATQLWLLWLGITDENNESPRGRVLPPFVEEVVCQSFLSFRVRDRLTLAFGFTHLIQSLLASIGRLIEDACGRESTSSGSGDTPANTTRDGDDAESDETMSMQTADMEWYRLLHELRAAFEQQTKAAMLQNVRWLRRLLHHRCVDSTSGQLLGLLRGHEGEVVALLAGAEADAGDVDSPAEARAQEQAHEDSLEEKYYEHLIREHESAACQDWDDWPCLILFAAHSRRGSNWNVVSALDPGRLQDLAGGRASEDEEAGADGRDAREDELDLGQVWQVLQLYRRYEGFSEDECGNIARLFDEQEKDETGELRCIDAPKALRALGYKLTFEAVQSIVAKVDVDDTGTLNLIEFRKMIRMLQERESNHFRNAMRKSGKGSQISIQAAQEIGRTVGCQLERRHFVVSFDDPRIPNDSVNESEVDHEITEDAFTRACCNFAQAGKERNRSFSDYLKRETLYGVPYTCARIHTPKPYSNFKGPFPTHRFTCAT
ncbi:unnamed protein product [Symbiodinium microadriaticum]|nr:unnamed protein product [Symbiodinium sp. KB8]CAE7902300.1 unnamed protein product [Symbiodinium microadriaticum]